MSELATAVTTDGGEGGFPPLPPIDRLLNRVRWVGYVLLGLQGLGLLVWSVILYEHFSLTVDYSQYDQAWFLFAHGSLDPYSTRLQMPFLQQDGEIILGVLAPLYWIFHSGLVLSVAQVLSLVGAEVVGFAWLCDLVRRHCAERDAALLAGLGVLLFIASPWLWWAVGFDVHLEPLVMFFAAYMAWDLSRGKRRAFAWAVPVLLGGAPATTYVVAIGLGGVLAGRQTRRMGAALTAMGIAVFLLLGLLHFNAVAANNSASLLATARDNPFRLVQELWDRRVDIFANLAPSGLLGIAAPLIMPLTVVVVISDTLASNIAFQEPSFQNIPLYVFLPVGTVAVLAWLLRRHRRTAFALAAVVAAQAVGWAAVWGPQTPAMWLRVSNAEAATLASVAARIPASAEVVASQGVVGGFSERAVVWPLFGPGPIPLERDTWFVITPTSAVETASAASSMAFIGELAGPLHATLVTHANGVWAFRLNPSPGLRSVTVPKGPSPLPAWAAEGAAGAPVLRGPVSSWHMAATGAKGYVADGIEWQGIRPGRYLADVTLSTTSAVNVEVWNNTTHSVLLARQNLLPTDGIQTIALPVNATVPYRATAYSGWGPFRSEFDKPPAGERLEVRVWSPGGAAVSVYSADLTTASGAPAPDQPRSP